MDITYVVKKGPKKYLTTFDPGRRADRWGLQREGIKFTGRRALVIARELAVKHGACIKRLVPKGMTWGVQVLFDATKRDEVLSTLTRLPAVVSVSPAYPRQEEVPLVYLRVSDNRETRLRDLVEDIRRISDVKTAGLELVPAAGATPLEVANYREQTGNFLPEPTPRHLRLVKTNAG